MINKGICKNFFIVQYHIRLNVHVTTYSVEAGTGFSRPRQQERHHGHYGKCSFCDDV